MIEVSHLTKKYGNHVAVDDLSFCVEEGQIYGFLGPNGAGKSTTMNMLTGYLGATSGEIKIDGHDIYKEPEEAKRNIGYLPELPPVYDTMTVKEYLAFVAELKKIDKKERRKQIGEVMELTKITSMQDRLIQNLPKGYKQRVGLAQAILGYPKIIILDEPTVGLDPKHIKEIRQLLKSLRKKHTEILSSHILPEVSAVCDHIMIIAHGRLAASDTPENLSRLMSGDNVLSMQLCGTEDAVRAAESHLKKGQAYLAGVKAAEAERIFPGHPDVSLLQAKIACLRYDYNGAERFLQSVFSSELADARAYELAGDIYAARKNYPQARSAYMKALKLPSNSGEERLNRRIEAVSAGVPPEEVDAKTLSSRFCAGLFFAGELLDVGAPCGGYNIQWAVSSGRLAGSAAARL